MVERVLPNLMAKEFFTLEEFRSLGPGYKQDALFFKWGEALFEELEARLGYLKAVAYKRKPSGSNWDEQATLTATSTQFWAIRLKAPSTARKVVEARIGFVSQDGEIVYPKEFAHLSLPLSLYHSLPVCATKIVRDLVREAEILVPVQQAHEQERLRLDRQLLLTRETLVAVGAEATAPDSHVRLSINSGPDFAGGPFGTIWLNWQTGTIDVHLYELSLSAIHQVTGFLLDSAGQAQIQLNQASGNSELKLQALSLPVARAIVASVVEAR